MSSLTIATPATSDPVSLAEAKAHLRVDSTDEDGLIVGYLLAARVRCEDHTKRALCTQIFDLKIDHGWPCVLDRRCMLWRRRIELPRPPLQSVTSITYVDSAGALQTLASDQYQVTKGDIVGAIEPAFGCSWPTARDQLDTITVRFVAGYGSNPGDTPEPIRQAILLTLAHFYENREAVIVGNIVTDLPLGVTALLAPYVAEGWA